MRTTQAWSLMRTGADGRGHWRGAAALDEIRAHGRVLTPGCYVGAEAAEDDGEPLEDKMRRLVAQLNDQMAEGRRLDEAIAAKLRGLGYGD